ncbi:DUF262 domain-containing protein [Sulfitobacter sp. R18_1]|uniref:DUF262 domain-containing protein n=1 Tax=Sulfitobacter sp. R18_1 TaxID=2821104 RepID=UPI001AD9E55A|nr:DUF262 domain-containing protein [Sulfitobacter sp. R18_1]MBO9428710.1 DUF262 domain-containing protein [Sulfitobacter sp. R18_1]
MTSERLMPPSFKLGQHTQSTMGYLVNNQVDSFFKPQEGMRSILGFNVPDFQRDLVWSEEKQLSFLESAWRGIPLGTFSINVLPEDYDHPFDGLILDGQQRLHTIERYLNDELPANGYLWSDLTPADKRHFKNGIHFPHYEVHSKDEMFLREYYDLMNFGGVDHKPEERALPSP